MDEDKWYAFTKSQQSVDWREGYAAALTDIRSKVDKLRIESIEDARSGNHLDRDFNIGKVYACKRVLKLLDGNS